MVSDWLNLGLTVTESSDNVTEIALKPRLAKAYSHGELTMKTSAIAYLRTSSATNVEGDSSIRQREAIKAYASANRIELVQEFYDAAVSGADPIQEREGFLSLLVWAEKQGVDLVLVENASRFARDLMVQELGLQLLKGKGIRLIAVDDPDAFTADNPTAQMVRQILGAVSQFEKAGLVAKLKGARDRKSDEAGKRVEGRPSYQEKQPELVREAKRLARRNPKTGEQRSLREISEELAKLGFMNGAGKPLAATQVQRLLGKG